MYCWEDSFAQNIHSECPLVLASYCDIRARLHLLLWALCDQIRCFSNNSNSVPVVSLLLLLVDVVQLLDVVVAGGFFNNIGSISRCLYYGVDL